MYTKRLFYSNCCHFTTIFVCTGSDTSDKSDSELKQVIGLTHFNISYSRPGKRGRQIMGEIIPYERIWRVGANESTKFRVSEDILVNGKKLKAGTYALYAFPHKKEWEVVFHRDTTHWEMADQYDPKMMNSE